MAPPGLEGVVVGESRLSRVDGVAGTLTLAGYAIEDLAPHVHFEQVVHLLWRDELPKDPDAWSAVMARARALGGDTIDVLRRAASHRAPPMAALRLGLSVTGLRSRPDVDILAAMPTLLCAYDRLRGGLEPIEPNPRLGLAADLLRMREGQTPEPSRARALDTYLCTVIDHGLNASAFAARVVASTGAEMTSCVEAGLCALEGPLHGGAPGPALAALVALRDQGGDMDALTRDWVHAEVAAGRRIMGFGHRVYQVRDPRSVVLRDAATELLGDVPLLRDARIHERAVLETLAMLKPGRALATNVEFATALLLHGLGFPEDLFTAIFAVSRTAGWIAHASEQRRTGRLIRPRLVYTGAERRVVAHGSAP